MDIAVISVQKAYYSMTFSWGRLTEYQNLLSGETYPVADSGMYYSDGGEKIFLEPYDCTETEDTLTFICANGRIVWHFLDTCCTVHTEFETDRLLTRVCVLAVKFGGAREVHFHDDCSLWHCPLCEFIRYEKGGAARGLAYPYWETDTADELAFSPYEKPDGLFVSETAFLTPFRKEGRTVTSHGPYPGKRKLKYHDNFGYGGLGQHFADGRVPEDAGVPEEETDTGEIRAMRSLMRHLLPEQKLPEDGYFIWQNGWWAGISSADAACLEPLEKAGIRDIMTAATYYGHDEHPSCEPSCITDTLAFPTRFPKPERAGVTAATLADGHHHMTAAKGSASDGSTYSGEFCAPPDYDALIREAGSRGIYVSSFSTPNNYYARYPEWACTGEDGEVQRYFGTRVSCPACRAYMEHHFDVLCRIFDKYRPRFWGFDGRFLSYSEFAGYGYGKIGETPCWSEGHGHLKGKGRYREWVNIRDFKKRLRARYPSMCLEEYYGLKRGSTWALEDLNSDENYYELAGADDNRFQAWHNENDRYRPTYMNFASVSGKTAEQFEYSLVSAFSISSYAQIGSGYTALRDTADACEIFKKWKSWADRNAYYLHDREFLFDCPGDCPVDGSAHIRNGEGYVFLFNTVDRDERVTLAYSDLPGLSGNCEVFTVTPEETRLTDLPEGGSFTVCVPPHRFAVLAVRKQSE